jgi:hypothetical protein
MIQLRGGAQTGSVKMDRIQEFDDRSRNFPIRQLIGASTPRSYTWRCNAQLDQGAEGSCVGFGVTHELIARPAEVKGLDEKYAKEQIYWEAQKNDPWDGGSYPGATPFYEGTSVLAGVKQAHKLGWMESYHWAFGIEDLKMGVGYHGPAVIGINWYSGMFIPDSNGFIHASGYVAGGHCILVNSVNIKKQRFTLHNSWGANWGIKGECYISFDDMNLLLKDRGEAVFFLKRHNKPQLEQ